MSATRQHIESRLILFAQKSDVAKVIFVVISYRLDESDS